jgi:hypothetical protein
LTMIIDFYIIKTPYVSKKSKSAAKHRVSIKLKVQQ